MHANDKGTMKLSPKCFRGSRVRIRSLLLQLTTVERVIAVSCPTCEWSSPSVEGGFLGEGEMAVRINFKDVDKRSGTG